MNAKPEQPSIEDYEHIEAENAENSLLKKEIEKRRELEAILHNACSYWEAKYRVIKKERDNVEAENKLLRTTLEIKK